MYNGRISKTIFPAVFAICDTIEELELFLKNTTLSEVERVTLQMQIVRLKQAQQTTESMLIADRPNILMHRLK